ncbi:hypothetical protein WA026_016031 [Henosepilachna vigintioctopunctata]|uniref:Cytochrome c oxidase assembly protein COX20, mitochondrial n=1 Tax=Henosepilachna vigintioctopunctata TaxID=420089 RepID=A0AAW1U7H6_9CUCU
MGDDSQKSSKELMLFGRDVSKIPCFRSTMINGIVGGIGCGLTYFLFTSRVKAATDVSVGCFVLISVGYWIRCRYKYSKNRFDMLRLQEALINKNLYEGTELERDLDSAEKVDV